VTLIAAYGVPSPAFQLAKAILYFPLTEPFRFLGLPEEQLRNITPHDFRFFPSPCSKYLLAQSC